MDSGAAPHSAIRRVHVPGTRLNPSTGKIVANANGKLFHNDGEFTLDSLAHEGHRKHITRQHADADLPVTSTGLLSDAGHDALYFKKHGDSIDNTTGYRSCFIRAQGVYFIKRLVQDACLTMPPPQPTASKRTEGLGGQG